MLSPIARELAMQKTFPKSKPERLNEPSTTELEIPHREVRETLWGAVWEVLRITGEDFLPEMPFKESVEMILMFNAIFNAHLARRPINQQRLADELGMSRPAVRRRLELFEARGVIEGGWQRAVNPIRISKAVLASPKSDERLRRLRQLIIDAGAALSKLEV
jgi:hypothetical protein